MQTLCQLSSPRTQSITFVFFSDYILQLFAVKKNIEPTMLLSTSLQQQSWFINHKTIQTVTWEGSITSLQKYLQQAQGSTRYPKKFVLPPLHAWKEKKRSHVKTECSEMNTQNNEYLFIQRQINIHKSDILTLTIAAGSHEGKEPTPSIHFFRTNDRLLYR